jgi:hypothetical protein
MPITNNQSLTGQCILQVLLEVRQTVFNLLDEANQDTARANLDFLTFLIIDRLDVYTIKVGRGETRREIQAMLYAQEQNEKGTRVRFFAGEGFGAEFFDGTPAMVVTKGAVTDDPEFDEAIADAAEAEKEVQELEQAAALEAEAESQAAAE